MVKNKFLVHVTLQYIVEGEDVGIATRAAEAIRLSDKIGNLPETKSILLHEIPALPGKSLSHFE